MTIKKSNIINSNAAELTAVKLVTKLKGLSNKVKRFA